MTTTRKNDEIFVAGLVVISGFAALAYEVAWVRELGLTLGKTTYSVSIILASFMGGIALGNILFSRWADRFRRPLAAFGLLEIAIGVTGLLLWLLFTGLGPAYRWFVMSAGLTIESGAALVIEPLVALVSLVGQTVFMGGTLPVMVRHLVRSRGDIGPGVARLYAFNTGGAVLGCFGTGFFLLPVYGVDYVIGLAVAANLAVGLTAYIHGRRSSAPAPTGRPTVEATDPRPMLTRPELGTRFLLFAYFSTGFTALAFELLWTRQLLYVVGTGAYAFAAMLTIFLLGMATGSSLYGRRFTTVQDQTRLFGIFQLLIGLFALLGIPLFYQLPFYDGLLRATLAVSGWSGRMAINGFLALGLLILPTFFFGASFPLVNRLYTSKVETLGRGVGRLAAANGAGGILGSALAGFALVPLFGVNWSIVVVAAVNFGLGGCVLALSAGRISRLRAAMITAGWTTGAIAGAALVLPLDQPLIAAGTTLNRRQVLYYEEGVDATLAVLETSKGNRLLDINGVVTAADTFTDIVVHKMLAHQAMLLHPEPRDVAVVGFGLGVTARSAACYPEVEHLDIIELVAQERETAGYFRHYNRDILSDPRVRFLVGDGRDHIGTATRQYDIISFNAIHPRLGPDLYTVDFYRLCSERLKAGGLVAGWIPTNWLEATEFRSLLATFIAVFPESTLWYVNPAHLVIVGGDSGSKIDVGSMRCKLEPGPVYDDLLAVFHHQLGTILAQYLMGPEGLRAYSAGVDLNTDSHSAVEYSRFPSMQIADDIVESLVRARTPLVSQLSGVPLPAIEAEKLAAKLGAHDDLIYAELFNWKYNQLDRAGTRIRRALDQDGDDPFLRAIAAGFGVTTPGGGDIIEAPVPDPAPVIYRRDPRDDPAHQFDIGMQHFQAQRVDEAIAALENAILLKPDYIAAYNNLGYAYATAKRYDEAVDAFERAIALDPQRAWLPHHYLSRIALGRRDDAAARQHLEAAIATNPYFTDSLLLLAELREEDGETERAQRLRAKASDASGP